MKKLWISLLVLSSFICSVMVAATGDAQESNEDVNIPSGLQTTQVSPGVRVVIPEGGRTRRMNPSLSVIEDADEYAARNFVEVNRKLSEFEKENEMLRQEIRDIKEKLDDLYKRFIANE